MYNYVKEKFGKIFVTCFKNNKKQYLIDNYFKPHIYVECSEFSGIKSYPANKNVTKIEFPSIKDYQVGKKTVYRNIEKFGVFKNMFEIQKIRNSNLNKNFNTELLKIAFFDIEVYSNKGFPEPSLAQGTVTCISLCIRETGKFYVWNLTDQYKKHMDNLEVYEFDNEKELLKDFFEWLCVERIDVLSGWNCIDENQTVWLKKKIKKIKNINSGNITCNDGLIKRHEETGKKENYRLKLTNGQEIISSENHIFPYYFKDKNKYKYSHTLLKNYKEDKVFNIIKEEKDIFLRVDKHNNTNEDLTLRQLILENFEYFENHPFFDFVLTDHQIKNWLKKNVDIKKYFERIEYRTGKTFWKNCKKLWSYKRLKNIVPKHMIINFLKTTVNLEIYGKLNNILKLDTVIDKRLIQFLGLIYTDGFYSKYDKYLSFCSKDEKMINEYVNDINKIFRRYKTFKGNSLKRRKDGCFYYSFTKNNILTFLLPIIYDNKLNKCLNEEILSSLSHRQFVFFVSGLIDGDGYVNNNCISICNYEESNERSDILKLQELFLWNNVYCKSNKNTIRFSGNVKENRFFIEKLNVRNSFRKNKIFELEYYNIKNSPSKHINFFEYDKFYLVRLKSIEKINKTTDMFDIETESHLFVSNGIKTHNCSTFDIPYLYNRSCVLGIDKYIKKATPFKTYFKSKVKDMKGEEINTMDIPGINFIDYLELYKKYSQGSREEYKLGFIGDFELGIGKLAFVEKELKDLWLNNKQKYVEYCIQDTNLLLQLDKKLGFMNLIYQISHYAGLPVDKCFGNTIIWTAKIYNELANRNMCFPPQENNMSDGIIGAFVKKPICKRHEWVVSFDLNSLYPSLIRQYNISHDTKVNCNNNKNFNAIDKMISGEFDFEKFKKLNLCILPKGAVFRKDKKGLSPILMGNLYNERKIDKKNMNEAFLQGDNERGSILNSQQYAKKILLNSFYGALTYKNFILYDKEMGESITTIGQVAIKFVSNKINDYLNKLFKTNDDYIIANDTDSAYINLNCFVEKIKHKNFSKKETTEYVNNICIKVIEPLIKKIYKEFAEYTGAFENHLVMEKEVIAESGIWTTKKRYALLVNLDDKGYHAEPKLKIVGMQTRRSDTPQKIRNKIKDCLLKILKGEDIEAYISNLNNEFSNYSIEEIAYPKGVDGIQKYSNKDIKNLMIVQASDTYTKGTPIHVRACILHNYLLEKNNLLSSYRKIQSKEKIKYVYLKEPNPLHENIIGFSDRLPKEFGLHEYVDYEKHFEKQFLKIIRDITDAINLKIDLVGDVKVQNAMW